MGKSKTVYFIGCAVLGPDIFNIADKLNIKLKKKLLPGGLHNRPNELRKRLQEAIDKAGQDSSASRIIIGYGLCGKGTVGIRSPGIPLVFPKVQDCIALFMGSDQEYKKEFAKFPGTFYISGGWFQEKLKEDKSDQIWVGEKSMGARQITDQYGEESGKRIIDFFTSWRKLYQRAAFIDTGIGKASLYEKHAKKMAREYDWQYQRIAGDLSLMTKLLTATRSDDQILVVPPSYVTVYSAQSFGLSAASPAEAKDGKVPLDRILVLDKASHKGLSIKYGLGIDAGGTYTDAAVYDFKNKALSAKNKSLTTKWDFSIGIEKSLSKLSDNLLSQVELVSVSTTLATNAIVEGEGQKTGMILMPPSGGVSPELMVHTPWVQVKGQMDISGLQTQSVDPDEIKEAADMMIRQHHVTAFAVSGFAGAVNQAHELAVKKIIQDQTGMFVSCGHELSDLLNFVVRAQTAVLNARIIPRMIKFFKALDQVLAKRGINAPVMVVKGDGTLMSSAMAKERPVETILSGPAASVAGAKLLTGLNDAMVVDIGGTTTDTANLSEGFVDVCESGARVGGYDTHVKALNMRTIGLGGDSLIAWHKGKLLLGPRRVAPVVWADTQAKEGVDKALAFMENALKNNNRPNFSQVILVAMKGDFPFVPTQEESKIYDLLLERPHALDELAKPLDLISAQFLPTKRLEESGLVQRCGFTPTDILHLNGCFQKWEKKAADRMLAILAGLSNLTPKALEQKLPKLFEKDLARELLKKQMARDVEVDGEETAFSRHVMDCILSGQNEGYSITAQLKHPVIGIGAPVQYFLPHAAQKLGAKAVIPKNADVANALGSITSHIMIKQKAAIKPGPQGYFVVQGIQGRNKFKTLELAEAWVIEQLKNKVQKMGNRAGTSCKTVEMKISDRIVNAGDGTPLFLDRTILATLSGSPDLALANAS